MLSKKTFLAIEKRVMSKSTKHSMGFSFKRDQYNMDDENPTSSMHNVKPMNQQNELYQMIIKSTCLQDSYQCALANILNDVSIRRHFHAWNTPKDSTILENTSISYEIDWMSHQFYQETISCLEYSKGFNNIDTLGKYFHLIQNRLDHDSPIFFLLGIFLMRVAC